MKLIIADDEYFIRQRIKKIICWDKMGLEFCGDFENGKEILDFLKQETADIIIIDIKMPHMDGLEAIRQIKELHPDIHIIILSGYNDFEYARTALKYGVKEYLLKPVSSDELENALYECILSIKKNRQVDYTVKLYEHYKLCTSLSDVRNGTITYYDFCIKYPLFSDFKYIIYASIFLSDNMELSMNRFAEAFRSSGFLCEYTQESENIFTIQIFLKTRNAASSIGSIFTEYVTKQKTYTFIYIENIFPIEENWRRHYDRCLKLLTQRFFSSKSDVFIGYVHPEEPPYQNELLKIRQNFLSSLNSLDTEIIENYIDELFLAIKHRKSCDYLRLIISDLFYVFHVYYNIPDKLAVNVTDFAISVIDTEYSLENIREEIYTYSLQCIRKSNTVPSDVLFCRKVTEYLEQNYTETDLTVTKLAEIFHLHPSYMGTIFKKVHHTSVLQYLADIRINEAKKLLCENKLKISEIAEATGFSDVYYFSKKFKKNCGVSPKEYAYARNPAD